MKPNKRNYDFGILDGALLAIYQCLMYYKCLAHESGQPYIYELS